MSFYKIFSLTKGSGSKWRVCASSGHMLICSAQTASVSFTLKASSVEAWHTCVPVLSLNCGVHYSGAVPSAGWLSPPMPCLLDVGGEFSRGHTHVGRLREESGPPS